MGGACSTYGEVRVVYRDLLGKPESKKPPGRPRRRWEGNIEMDLQKVKWRTSIGLIWLRIGTGGGRL